MQLFITKKRTQFYRYKIYNANYNILITILLKTKLQISSILKLNYMVIPCDFIELK